MGAFFHQYPFLVPAIAWFIAQSMKYALSSREDRSSMMALVRPGGMPSVHSCVAASLATLIAVRDGLASTTFTFAVTFFFFVLFDAMIARVESGHHASSLNRLHAKLFPGHDQKVLKEILGHRPEEVFIGSLLGVAISLILTFTP